MCMYLISYLDVLFGVGITCQSEQLWNVIITCANACARRKLKARVWFAKLSVHYFLTLLLPLEDVRTVDQRTPGRSSISDIIRYAQEKIAYTLKST